LEYGFRRAVDRGGTYKLPDVVARYPFCNDLGQADTRDLQQRLCAEPASVVFERMQFGVPEGMSRGYVRDATGLCRAAYRTA